MATRNEKDRALVLGLLSLALIYMVVKDIRCNSSSHAGPPPVPAPTAKEK